MKIDDILKEKIKWVVHPHTNRYYVCNRFQNMVLLLRMNDFPDEPLFTIILNYEILDIDDLPACWDIKY